MVIDNNTKLDEVNEKNGTSLENYHNIECERLIAKYPRYRARISNMLDLGVNCSQCEKIISTAEQIDNVSMNNIFLNLAENKNLIASDYYDYATDIAINVHKSMKPDIFEELKYIMCNELFIESDFYKCVVDNAYKIKEYSAFASFSSLALTVIVDFQSQLEPVHIEKILDTWSTKSFNAMKTFENYVSYLEDMPLDKCLYILDLVSKIDNPCILEVIFKIVGNINAYDFKSLKSILDASVAVEDVNILNNFNSLLDVLNSTPACKKNVENNVMLLMSIAKIVDIFSESEKFQLYSEMAKILNLENKLIVANCLNEIHIDLEKCIMAVNVLKYNLTKPAEERIKKYSYKNGF